MSTISNSNEIELTLDAPEVVEPMLGTDTSDTELTLEADTAPAVVTPSTNLTEIQQQAEILSPAEKKKIADFAAKINIHDTTVIARYGESAQSKSASFSEKALTGVRGKDLGEVGDMITGLVVQIKGFVPAEDKKGLAKLFQRGKSQLEVMKANYNTVAKNIDSIKGTLEGHRLTLLKDVKVMDQLFESNLQFFKELTMYVLAGKTKLKEVEQGELVELQQYAAKTGLPEDAQRARDLAEQCNRFEKRIYDLELTRTICIQMAPQIRMVQGTMIIMADKIQTSIANTIPLWKNQIILALGLEDSKRATAAQKQVSDITNQLLSENATKLQMNTIEAAKESERGIVDIETLIGTNEKIIATLDEVLAIQKEGKQKRRDAEVQLREIENQLKVRLLEASSSRGEG